MKFVKQLWMTIFLLAFFLELVPSQRVSAEAFWPAGPEVKAESAIVMEADTGAILYEKNIHVQHYPASTTKIMTTLLALEHAPLQDIVTFSRDSIYKTEGSLVGFMIDEQIPLEQCLYAVMLASGNEAAYAVAEHIGGTLDSFVNMMNEKAAALGCTETHFSNPHGLPDETHVTSAHDLALIAREAYKNESFRTITRTVSYSISPSNKSAEPRPIYNHHSMLRQGVFKYDYCTGGKTGYTNAARNTLVTYAEKNDVTLICVIMKDDVSKDQYLDTTALLDYGFNNFKKIPVSEHELGLQLSSEGFFPIRNNPLTKDAGKIMLDTSSELVIPNQSTVTDIASAISFTEQSQNEIAVVTCRLDEHFVGNVSILYTPGKNSIQTDSKPIETQKKAPDKPFPIKKGLLILLIVFCILGVIGVILYCIRNGIFEPSYIKEGPKMKKHKKIRTRSSIRRSKQNKETKPAQKASVGSAKTPKLQSEFDVWEHHQDE